MLKNKNILLFMLVLFGSSFVQADWRDTLRWLQNNAKQHVTAKKVAAVVGVAALCAVGVGCWWKLRQPAEVNKDTRYAYRIRLFNKSEDAKYQMSEDGTEGYKLFSLYYTDKHKQVLDHLFNDGIAKAQNIMEGYYNLQESAAKSDYFKNLFSQMSATVRTYDPQAEISVGMVFVDSKKNTLYAVNIGTEIVITNDCTGEGNATQKENNLYLGLELHPRDVQIVQYEISNSSSITALLSKTRANNRRIKHVFDEEIRAESQATDEFMATLVKKADVALAVNVSYYSVIL